MLSNLNINKLADSHLLLAGFLFYLSNSSDSIYTYLDESVKTPQTGL